MMNDELTNEKRLPEGQVDIKNRNLPIVETVRRDSVGRM